MRELRKLHPRVRAAVRRREWLQKSGGGPPFSPLDVPEVVAGYFWDPAAGSGSGAAGFTIPEGNGKTAYDMITPAANTAPTLGTINGHAVATYANAAPDQLARIGLAEARGWTGATMFWGWFFSPSGVGPGTVFGHFRSGQNAHVSLGTLRCDVAGHDGVSLKEHQNTQAAGWLATPVYIEFVFDPSQVATNRLQLWVNRVQQTPIVAQSMGATLQDTASFISFSGEAGDSSIFNLVTDFSHGVSGITNGVPSAAARDLLFAYKRLV